MPAPHPSRPERHEVASTDGVSVVVHDHGGDGPAVLWCHATGFHGRYWDPICDRLDTRWRHVTVDFRGHGDTVVTPGTPLSWTAMADDVLAVVAALDLDPVLGVGHSMGGCVIVLAELAAPGTFTGAWLFEPICIPDAGGPFGPASGSNPLADVARRRRPVFGSREDAFERYHARPPFDRAEPAMLAAYVEHGFRDRSDGAVELKCAPETEAEVYERSRTGVYERLGSVTMPVVVNGSGDGDAPARVAPAIAASLPFGRHRSWPDLTHFGPMEAPDAIAEAIEDALAGWC